MQRYFFSGATETELDKQGRVGHSGHAARAREARPRGRRRGRLRPPRDLGPRRLAARARRGRRECGSMLPNVLQPSETDHVPVLADEVRECLAVRPGDTVVDGTFGAGGHAALLAGRPAAASGKLIAIDRDPTVAPYFERLEQRERVQARLLRGEFGVVLPQLAANGVRADAILLDLGVSSMQLDRPERGFSYAVDAPLDMRMDPSQDLDGARRRQRVARARARLHLPPLRRGAVRAPDRARDRPPPQGAAVRAHRRARRHDQVRDPGAGALRRGASGEARLPGAAHRRQRRARLARGGAAGGARDAAARRPARGDLLPLARGPDRQAVPARRGARLHLPARLPGLRLRARARAARDPAPAGPAGRGRGRRNPRAASARLRAAVKVGSDLAAHSTGSARLWLHPRPPGRRAAPGAGRGPGAAPRVAGRGG